MTCTPKNNDWSKAWPLVSPVSKHQNIEDRHRLAPAKVEARPTAPGFRPSPPAGRALGGAMARCHAVPRCCSENISHRATAQLANAATQAEAAAQLFQLPARCKSATIASTLSRISTLALSHQSTALTNHSSAARAAKTFDIAPSSIGFTIIGFKTHRAHLLGVPILLSQRASGSSWAGCRLRIML
jgi:hypothetical protein